MDNTNEKSFELVAFSPEDRTKHQMNDSSRQLLSRVCNGENQAAIEVYDRYVARLLKLIRRRISPQLQRRVDEEDVVQSAMCSFFIRAVNEDFVLMRSGDLWRLLTAITLSKLRRQVEVHTAAKRAVNREQHVNNNDDRCNVFIDREPSPDEEAAIVDELIQVMKSCNTFEREALQLRLTGETIESIAELMGRSQRTVRRLLQVTRKDLEHRLLDVENQ